MQGDSKWSDERHEEAKKRCAAASPGPWVWREDQFRPKYMRRVKVRNPGPRSRDWVAKRGCNARDSWLLLLTSPGTSGDPVRKIAATEDDIVSGRVDEWDYQHLIAVRWSDLKRDSVWNATPTTDDAAFMAQARADLPDALAEIDDRLKAELDAAKAVAR